MIILTEKREYTKNELFKRMINEVHEKGKAATAVIMVSCDRENFFYPCRISN